MQLLTKIKGASTIALLALSACGETAPSSEPGGGGGGGGGGGTPPSYEKLDSTADVTSVLGGGALHYSTGKYAYTPLTGSLEHGTGKLTIDDGTLVFVDPDGLRDTT